MKIPRGFVIVYFLWKKQYLLLTTYKKSKAEHLQLPGGRYDSKDLESAKRKLGVVEVIPPDVLYRFTAVRELYEETGIDIRDTPEMLIYLHNDNDKNSIDNYGATGNSSSSSGSTTRFKSFQIAGDMDSFNNKYFYYLLIEDVNSPCISNVSGKKDTGETGGLGLRMSSEHSGYTFMDTLADAATRLTKHSGGDPKVVVEALCNTCNYNDLLINLHNV